MTIHRLADVQSQKIGEGTTVWQFSVILPGAVIGRNCNINAGCFIENDVVLGDEVTVKSGVQIWDGIRIADRVFIGPNVTFTNDLLPRSKMYPATFAKTVIASNASIGANSTILAGIEIGRFALIAAGSVVTKNVPPFTVVKGNPARFHSYITSNNIILDANLNDAEGNQYKLNDAGEPVSIL